ncbi:hypothetical protein [Flavobacterium sp. ZE23DGlu08]|uniref:phosphoribosyltransferase-like protein n=1 Tax=Flavobacterium sp. ZE23DGlu08 TaxID=3059026 RepID=UPI00265F8F46|nr:hypothetical protein [Flavobacterium sp. ZE23DGlu08]WKL43737.1 hypothetical protein Q1W72_15485 [Flavobacterium sp. ZE23DGlu08]
MQETVVKIFEILQDYHCDNPETKHKMSVEHIINWANQFGDDAEFILSELLHFLPQIYISKSKAIELLEKRLVDFQAFYKYQTMQEFIMNTHFIDVQKAEKSQKEILPVVKEILDKHFGINYDLLIDQPKKHYIYFDDVLATGGTVYKDLSNWLSESNNLKKVLNKEKTIALSLFCYHKLGFDNIEWRLMKAFDDKIKNFLLVGFDYKIENQLKPKWVAEKQALNCIYPIEKQPKEILEYLASLEGENTSIAAFRPVNLPTKEIFFSSPANRIRFENIILEKGLELIQKIKKADPDPRKRPLGDTVKSHRTLGTGTLFFTWRNISNTCPIVFWWDVPGHEWIPLFCLKNRGTN